MANLPTGWLRSSLLCQIVRFKINQELQKNFTLLCWVKSNYFFAKIVIYDEIFDPLYQNI